jgi:hypothetical protein
MIDSGLNYPWPREVTEAAAKFEQGDLIKASVRLFYQRNTEHPVWRRKDVAAGSKGSEIAPFDPPPYAIITAQSCDVAEEGQKEPRWPWFQAAPVYRLEGSPEEIKEALNQMHFYELTAPTLQGEGTWVADLRIELPVEKGELVGKEPIKGFGSEKEARAFGKYLGAVRERPAFADALIQALSTTFRKTRSNNRNRKELWQDRRDEVLPGGIRLHVQEGSNLDPRVVAISIWTLGPISDALREWFGFWWDLANLEIEGIKLLPLTFEDATAADLRVYEKTENSGLWQG